MRAVQQAVQCIAQGYRILTGGRPGRTQMFAFLQYLMLGVRVGRLWFDSRFVLEKTGLAYYNQCRYRWRLVALGLLRVQRTGRGSWHYDLNWEQLYGLAVMSGFRGTLSEFKTLCGYTAKSPQDAVTRELLETAADQLRQVYSHSETTPLSQVVTALRWAVTQYGESAIEKILSSACQIARRGGRIAPPKLLRFIYGGYWKQIERSSTVQYVRTEPTDREHPPPREGPSREQLRDALRQLYGTEPTESILDAVESNISRALGLIHAPQLFKQRYPTLESLQ